MDEDVPAATQDVAPSSLRDVLRFQRLWLAVVSAATVAAGMAYSLWWPSLVRHQPFYWIQPADFWSTFRDAHYVAWGSLSYVYGAVNTHLVTLPGYPIFLAPVAALSSALNLTESSPTLMLVHPQAWLIAGPFEMLTAATVALFGADAVARDMGVPPLRRRVLPLLVGASLWAALTYWGHPEDVMAIGFLLLSISALSRGRDTAAGWFLGAAVAMQLFVLPAIPLLLVYAGRARIRPLLLRSAVLPFFCGAATIPDIGHSLHALIDQPNFPLVDHPTPWIALSPHISRVEVAAGPARLLGLGAAMLCVAWFSRGDRSLDRLIWMIGLVMTLRAVFEAVMVPYYVMPAIICGVLGLLLGSPIRAAAGVSAAATVSFTTFLRMAEWPYWTTMTALLLAIAIAARPRAAAARRSLYTAGRLRPRLGRELGVS